jgi:hypothetical protein
MNMKKKIALVTMAKEEDLYLQEWIDYHLKLGFDAIYIYQNNWRFKNQIPNDRVHFLEWDLDSLPQSNPNAPWEWNRHAICYSTFGKDYHNEYEWAAFFDVDCFLDLKKTDNVKSFISEYDNIKESHLVIDFAIFGDNGHSDFSLDNTSVLERFTKRWGKPYNHSYYGFLPICKLHSNFGKHAIHFIDGEEWSDVNFVIGSGFGSVLNHNRIITYEKAQLNHYFCKTLPEWMMKMQKTRAEGDSFKNSMEAFHQHNFNDIEDAHALDFFKKNI